MSDPYVRSQERSSAFRFLLYGMWVYLAGLSGSTVYTVLWFVGAVDGRTETIGIVWIVITSLGAAFILIVVPIIHRSRLSLY